jgi:hypothetical protein
MAGKKRCVYCGAAAQMAAGSEMPPVPDAQHQPSPQNDDSVYVRLDDLPEELRRRVEQALHSKKPEVAVTVEETVSTGPEMAPPDRPAIADGIESVSKTLESMRQSFDADRIDYDEYREMVLRTLKQFLEGMEPKTALGFVLNELKTSTLDRYIDEAIYNTLCAGMLTAATPPVEKPKPWSFGIFRKKRK